MNGSGSGARLTGRRILPHLPTGLVSFTTCKIKMAIVPNSEDLCEALIHLTHLG